MLTHPAVSVICVFNDPDVRRACLDRSLADHTAEGMTVELIAVDNTDHAFGTAGEALNHGASLATHDYLAFVHQDVYFHSLTALTSAAAHLRDPGIGMLGVVGVRADGSIAGRIRDRVLLIGESVPEPVDVDSLDEVLFLLAKARWLVDPLSTRDDLAWHAYAVEYGLRMVTRGLRVAAIDIPVTHNSLTTNLAKLEQAHATVAMMYPGNTPVRTTCGTVGAPASGWRDLPLVRSQRWRRRWLQESMAVRRLSRFVPGLPMVLWDIRQNIDSVIAGSQQALHVFNIDRTRVFVTEPGDALELTRIGRTLTVSAGTIESVVAQLQEMPWDAPALVTNVNSDDLRYIGAQLVGRQALLGYHGDTGTWLLLGDVRTQDVAEWTSERVRPLLAAATHGSTGQIGQSADAPLR